MNKGLKQMDKLDVTLRHGQYISNHMGFLDHYRVLFGLEKCVGLPLSTRSCLLNEAQYQFSCYSNTHINNEVVQGHTSEYVTF